VVIGALALTTTIEDERLEGRLRTENAGQKAIFLSRIFL